MPYKSGKLKGELTTAEIRKLIRAHNKLTDIKIPKGATRDDILNILEDAGYAVNHVSQSLRPRKVDKDEIKTLKPKVSLEQAKEITKPKTVSKEDKEKRMKKKKEKEDKIKAEGVKQGAALQKVIAKRNLKKKKEKEDKIKAEKAATAARKKVIAKRNLKKDEPKKEKKKSKYYGAEFSFHTTEFKRHLAKVLAEGKKKDPKYKSSQAMKDAKNTYKK